MLVAIGLDAIGVDVHQQGAALAAGGGADHHRERCEGHRPRTRCLPGRKDRGSRQAWILAAGVAWGTVGEAGAENGAGWADTDRQT